MSLIGLVLLSSPFAVGAAKPPLVTVELTIGPHRLSAELAHEPATRQRGLMHRSALPEDQGMLFVFPTERRHCMWMRDTLIPLSVAFVDARGTILNIADMTPLSEQARCATGASRYALEMPRGWFERRGILAGQHLTHLEGLPAAR